jgi:hypothetical protein
LLIEGNIHFVLPILFPRIISTGVICFGERQAAQCEREPFVAESAFSRFAFL